MLDNITLIFSATNYYGINASDGKGLILSIHQHNSHKLGECECPAKPDHGLSATINVMFCFNTVNIDLK